uniref:Uncharacterized protein n=1 Tax=Steinernema glaseri TaxID=37863 RepID=A0A1I7Z9C3_9BILA
MCPTSVDLVGHCSVGRLIAFYRLDRSVVVSSLAGAITTDFNVILGSIYPFQLLGKIPSSDVSTFTL